MSGMSRLSFLIYHSDILLQLGSSKVIGPFDTLLGTMACKPEQDRTQISLNVSEEVQPSLSLKSIYESHAKVPDLRDEIKEIADLGKSLPVEGFDDMNEDDINQLFESHNVELTERELIELTENNYEAQEKGEDDEVPAPK
ncbi:unnamed protein product [Acanthoscelides obtectus]|uniref:Uncharacterized protein n=1 Tax=Acanthoscelides obtectus TaxID=200917 RepID=A0A9P0M3M5_ACAOB|nr:unnamed protein product [Acanthoscelides obtectus]CAK1658850.1 hypothetical protein AOBTE_LOCUS21163 [Acanthoscelides obtectus]